MSLNRMMTALLVAAVMIAGGIPVFGGAEDDAIVAAVKGSHVFRNTLKDDDIRVEAKDGIVNLSGTVSEQSHKEIARDTVIATPGVRGVEDKQLKVLGAPVIKSDAWLTAKVKATLLFHRNVDALTRVNVKNGIVILRGEAVSQAQKDLTSEYARDVRGVKGVRNEMIVVAPKKKEKPATEREVDDASVTSMVKMTLLSHASTSGLKIDVETHDGEVTLTGTVKSAAERDLVGKYVDDVVGVKRVDNQVMVQQNR